MLAFWKTDVLTVFCQQQLIEIFAIDLACLVRDQMLWMTADASNEFHVG